MLLVVAAVMAFFGSATMSLKTASASDQVACYDVKGSGTYVPTGSTHNAGKITFDPDWGPPDYGFQGCVDQTPDIEGLLQVKGWAWNDNLGWVSFYCKGGDNLGVGCGGTDYDGVKIDPNTGNLSGYAWGDNIGWINMSCIAGQDSLGNDCGGEEYYVHAEEADPKCLGQVYAGNPPDGACAENDNNSVFAWADSVGWINFAEVKFPWGQLNDKFVKVDFSIDYNGNAPAALNRETAPLADNTEAYTMKLAFTDMDGNPVDLGNYNVKAEVEWKTDSVSSDQTISQVKDCKQSNGGDADCAVVKPITEGEFSDVGGGVLEAKVKSVAPTSVMNGHSDGAGGVDFDYESFVWPTNLVNVVPKHELVLNGVKVSVVSKGDGACVFGSGQNCDTKSVVQNLGMALNFKPALEVTKLDDKVSGDYLTLKPDTAADLDLKVECALSLGGVCGNNTAAEFNSGFDDASDYYFGLQGQEQQQPFNVPDLNQGTVKMNTPCKDQDGVDPLNCAGFGQKPYVYSVVNYMFGGKTVKYYSNKLAKFNPLAIRVVPVASIKGNVYSTTVSNLASDPTSLIKSLGDQSTNLYATVAYNVAMILAGVEDPAAPVPGSQVVLKQTNGEFGFDPSTQGKALLPDNNGAPRVFYFKGDLVIGNDTIPTINWSGERTILVRGGNVFIKANLFNQGPSPKPKLGIIVLKDFLSNKGGNVYVDPGVGAIQANMFMDGSLFSFDGNVNNILPKGEPVWANEDKIQEKLKNQLYFEGSVSSLNTFGGAIAAAPILGDGTEVAPAERARARLYDFNFLRYFGQVFQRDFLTGAPKDLQNNNDIKLTLKIAGGDLLTSQEAGLLQGNKSPLLDDDKHPFAVYFVFDPPSSRLPGFGALEGLDLSHKLQ